MFALIGETLRRIRKERDKTLEDIGKEAGLGRGQLSKIENAKQEATLTTIAKILTSQGMSRREFFRRYELVEDEALTLRAEGHFQSGDQPEAETATALPPEGTAAVEQFFGTFGAFFRELLQKSGPIAQGAVEVGELTVLFQVVPRRAAEPAPSPVPAGSRRSKRAAQADSE
jgi:transcriptional regulator with XRE-family HTH domain